MAETDTYAGGTKASTVAYACPNCRAGLTFSPEKNAFSCEFCLSTFTEAELAHTDAAEKAKEAEKNAEEFCATMQDYVCPNCGAEVMADEHTAADFCCYCHNPIVLQGRLSGQMKPDKVVPFQIDKEGAKQKFLAWAKKRIFAPKDFTSPDQIEKLQGIYYPFWVTDADTGASIKAHTTRVRSWRTGKRIYTETSHYEVSRQGDIHFEDISTSALKEAEKEMLEGILPYPSDQLIPFTPTYLSGFLAKKRNIERAELTGEVRGKMEEYAKELLRREIRGYATVAVHSSELKIMQSHWEYSLFPIWMLVYRGKKKDYTFAMNGTTGKMYGKVPISPLKLGLFAGAMFVVGFLLAMLYGGWM